MTNVEAYAAHVGWQTRYNIAMRSATIVAPAYSIVIAGGSLTDFLSFVPGVAFHVYKWLRNYRPDPADSPDVESPECSLFAVRPHAHRSVLSDRYELVLNGFAVAQGKQCLSCCLHVKPSFLLNAHHYTPFPT